MSNSTYIDADSGIFSESIVRFTPTLLKVRKEGLLTASAGTSLILALIEFLIDPVDKYFLKFVSRFLTPDDYDEVVNERNILHICGYPLCSEKREKKSKNKAFSHQIIPREPGHLILPTTYLSHYCCKEHFQSSTFYKKQLSTEAIWLRPDITWLKYGQCTDYELQIVLLEELNILGGSKSIKEIAKELENLSIYKNDTLENENHNEITINKITPYTIPSKGLKISGVDDIKENNFNKSSTNMEEIQNIDDQDLAYEIEGYNTKRFIKNKNSTK